MNHIIYIYLALAAVIALGSFGLGLGVGHFHGYKLGNRDGFKAGVNSQSTANMRLLEEVYRDPGASRLSDAIDRHLERMDKDDS